MDKIWDESTKLNRLLMLGVIGVLVFLSLTIFFYNEAATSRTIDANSRVEEVSEQYQSAIINEINGEISTIVAMSSAITSLESMDESEILDYFSKVMESNDFIRISFTRTNGIAFMVDKDGNKTHDVDFRNRADIQTALKGEEVLSASFDDEISGKTVNSHVVPVYYNNQVIGAITAVHTSDVFYNIITSEIFNGKGQTYVINDEGELVINNLSEHNTLSSLKDKLDEKDYNQLINNVKNQSQGVYNVSIKGDKYVCAVVPLGINNWSIYTIVPLSYFHLGYEVLVMIFTGALLLIVAVFIGMLFYIKKLMFESRESIIKLAYYDPLTGMYNRYRYMEVVSELINDRNAYAFVLIDISNFKFINETYGYENGNDLLKHIANVLEKHMLKGEACFRDNADCFGMLMVFSTKEALDIRLENIVKEISLYSFDSNEHYNIICNCGIKVIDNKLKNGKDVEIIFDRALLALAKAKGNHVSTYVYFNNEMESQSQKKFMIENSMRTALENHEFKLYLQPKIDIESGKVIGAEALCRWVVDDKIAYYPDEFIPVFEENGFICELDLYMLEEVCMCLKKGLEKGYPMVPISINQSKVLFYRMNYLDSLKQILYHYHIDPSLIIIEVTETVTMENMEGVKDVIAGLHKLGFKVSMDDFGSGYSSLNVLQKLDIDELKLDREFMINSDSEEKQKKVIESVVSLAKELHITTVSEGVETMNQLEYLKLIKCDIAQGYLYSKPIPYSDLMNEIFVNNKWKV